jgi:hypothetical protein
MDNNSGRICLATFRILIYFMHFGVSRDGLSWQRSGAEARGPQGSSTAEHCADLPPQAIWITSKHHPERPRSVRRNQCLVSPCKWAAGSAPWPDALHGVLSEKIPSHAGAPLHRLPPPPPPTPSGMPTRAREGRRNSYVWGYIRTEGGGCEGPEGWGPGRLASPFRSEVRTTVHGSREWSSVRCSSSNSEASESKSTKIRGKFPLCPSPSRG